MFGGLHLICARWNSFIYPQKKDLELMTWKEFLNPSILKVIIAAAIFFVIFYIFIFIPSTMIRMYALLPAAIQSVALDVKWICCHQPAQNQNMTGFCDDYTNHTGFVFTVESCNAYIADRQRAANDYYIYSTVMFIVSIIAAILISYFVSCFIVWLVFSRRKNVVQDEKMSEK